MNIKYLIVVTSIFLTSIIAQEALADPTKATSGGSARLHIPGTEQVVEMNGKQYLMRSAGPNSYVIESEEGEATFQKKNGKEGFSINSNFAKGVSMSNSRVSDLRLTKGEVRAIYNQMYNDGVKINGIRPSLADLEALFLYDAEGYDFLSSVFPYSIIDSALSLVGIQSAHAGNSSACYNECANEFDAAGVMVLTTMYVCGSVAITAGASLIPCVLAGMATQVTINTLESCIQANEVFCKYQDMQ